jgi:hypothetical protein
MIRNTIVLASLAVSMFAQSTTQPPALVRIVRNQAAPDFDPIRGYVDAQTQVNVLGINSLTGSFESWLIEFHESFASIEAITAALASTRQTQPAMPTDSLPLAVTTIAVYRSGLSYRPGEAAAALPKARYLNVSVYRIRAGADLEFVELMRIRRRGLDAVNMDRPEIAYQVISGAPSGTYVFVSPLATLKTLDDGIARLPVYAEVMAEAGADAGRKLAAEAELARESRLFRMDPRISYVSDDFAAADTVFWRGK